MRHGDRVGTIAPNTHQHLEQFYAIPQIGAVIVPTMNFRLTAEDFGHTSPITAAAKCCAFIRRLWISVDRVREHMTQVEHFVALEEPRAGRFSTTKHCSRQAMARSSARDRRRP